MWCLLRFLPIMIGDVIDEDLENWHCFQKLWNIVQICLAPLIKKDDVAYLRILIQEHHIKFKDLYPNASIIPKMHFLIHIPDEIVRFGPPRNVWTMRFEAKHSSFKSCVSKNFKNIPKSLAFKHQRNMCWNLLPSTSEQIHGRYLYSGDIVGQGDHNIDLKQHQLAALLFGAAGLAEVPETFVESSVKRVQIHGTEYRPGCALRVEEMDDIGISDYPSYVKVEEIIIWEDEKFFISTVLRTLAFHQQFMAYEVLPINEKNVVLLNNLSWKGALNIVIKNGKYFIVEKESASVEDTEI